VQTARKVVTLQPQLLAGEKPVSQLTGFWTKPSPQPLAGEKTVTQVTVFLDKAQHLSAIHDLPWREKKLLVS
jgi:hypothetical protein